MATVTASHSAPSSVAAARQGAARGTLFYTLLELLVVAASIWLRFRFDRGHEASWGFDSSSHWSYMRWIATRHELPPIKAFRAAYHPPLYYWLGGLAMRHGISTETLRRASAVTGGLKLCLLAWGVRRNVPWLGAFSDGARGQSVAVAGAVKWPIARVVALALAGVLPCALHLDGMLTNESLEGLLALAAMLLALELFRSSERRRWRLAPSLALALAAALLTKVSALIIIASIGLGLALETVLTDGALAARVRRALPGGAALLVALVLAVPVHARHYKTTGRIFPTGYEGGARSLPKEVRKELEIPYWQRRQLAYVYGLGTADIFREPFDPVDIEPDSRFWPVLWR